MIRITENQYRDLMRLIQKLELGLAQISLPNNSELRIAARELGELLELELNEMDLCEAEDL